MGTVFTQRFETDHIGSQVPVKLMHLEGLYELFISKFVSSCLFIIVILRYEFFFFFLEDVLKYSYHTFLYYFIEQIH